MAEVLPTVRARAEELRTRVMSRIEELRGGSSSSSSPLLKGEILKGPLATEIRERGLVATARARIEKVRAGGRILGGGSPSSPPVLEEKEKRVRGSRVLL